MYRFLMVDDEEIVRRGFEKKVDWNGLGFEFLEPCRDGREAIDAVDRLKPDVVLTDIYMPHTDGLAVAAYTAEHNPDTIVVILSGYDDFQYAQRAIRSNVYDYILKPVTSRELSALVLRLKERLDTARLAQEQHSELKSTAEIGRLLIRTRYLLELVETPRAQRFENGAAEFQEMFGFSPAGMYCSVVAVEFEPSASQANHSEASLMDRLSEIATTARWALPFSTGETRGAVIVFHQTTETCDAAAVALATRLVCDAQKPLMVSIGSIVQDWRRAAVSYEDAVAGLAYRLVSGPGRVFRNLSGGMEDPELVSASRALSEQLSRKVLAGAVAETPESANRFLLQLSDPRFTPQRVRHEVDGCFTRIVDGFAELGVAVPTIGERLGDDFYRLVESLRTTEEVLRLAVDLSGVAASILAKRNLPVPEWKVMDYKEYVARHFSDPDLSIQRVSAALGISASYLSKLIKRHLNSNFVDYLVSYRMQQATTMLTTTDYLTYEIAAAVGYPDARYFASTFKRHVGMTASEYRAENRRNRQPG